MGLACSRKQAESGRPAPARLSPWRRTFSGGRRAGRGTAAPPGARVRPAPGSLLALAADAVAASLADQAPGALRALPPDLSQLVLDRLVASGALDDDAVARLWGQQFYEIELDGYPEEIKDWWLRCLATPLLEVAVLNSVGVTDELLAALGALPRLTKLHLAFSEELSDAGLAALAGFPAVEELSLKGCELLTQFGLAWVARCTRLVRLDLEQCHLASGLAQLAGLQWLEHLNLGWCSSVGDVDAAAIAQLPRLRELHVCRTKVTNDGLRHFSALRRLEVLGLAGCDVGDGAVAVLLPSLPTLSTLNLQRCARVGDAALAAAGRHCPSLRELNLSYTRVSDAGMSHLSRLSCLRSLTVEACDITDRGLEVLTSLTGLETLDLADTGAGNGCMPAVSRMPNLRCLDLSFTGVDDWGLKRLPRLGRLARLNLDSRTFTNAGMEAVAQLASLEALDVFGAALTDAGCRHLSKLGGLRSLEICSGTVTDAGVALLAGGMPRLRHLSLAQNRGVTNLSVAALMRLPELAALNLSQTRVTDHAVVALGCLCSLETLALAGTKVRASTVHKLHAINPRLEVTGVTPLLQQQT